MVLKFSGLLFVFLVLPGYLSFQSSYEDFIDFMDSHIEIGKTVTQEDYNPRYPHGYFIADSK